MKQEELKPCPFCGSNNIRVIEEIQGDTEWVTNIFVYCNNCHAYGPCSYNLITDVIKERELAIKKWNEAKR